MTDYLAAMRTAFGAAIAAGAPRSEATLEVGGHAVRIVCAGRAMAEATFPALAPALSRSSAEPVMTIELWDSSSSGIAPPPTPWDPVDVGPLGVVRASGGPARRTVVDGSTRTITVADDDARHAVVWTGSASQLPSWWRAVPLRVALDLALAGPGRRMVHAGAIGVDGRGVLVAGRGGAGKSTVSVACACAGMQYVGDDYVLVETGPPARARAIFGTAKLDERALAELPAAMPAVVHPATKDAKGVLDLHAVGGLELVESVELVAIVLPVIGAARTELLPSTPAAALSALAPSTIFQAVGEGAPTLAVLAELARDLPAFELSVGPDLSEVAPVLAGLVETAAARRGARAG
jgi:hypothetical protein